MLKIYLDKLLEYTDEEIWSNESQIRGAFTTIINVVRASNCSEKQFQIYLKYIEDYAYSKYDILI